MQKCLFTFGFFVATVLVSGCTPGYFSRITNGEPTIADSVWLLKDPRGSNTTNDPQSNPSDEKYFPVECNGKPPSLGTVSGYDPANFSGEDIILCTSAMRQLIDLRFNQFAKTIHSTINDFNTGVDIATLGFNAAGTLSPGATSQIMNAISGALTGVKTKVDSDLLYSKSIELIIMQMEKDRASAASVLEARLAATKTKDNPTPATGSNGYQNMFQAANDLLVYARAGSWTHALVQMSVDSGVQTSACQAQEKNTKINGSASTGTGDSSSTSSKCPPSSDPGSVPGGSGNSGQGDPASVGTAAGTAAKGAVLDVGGTPQQAAKAGKAAEQTASKARSQGAPVDQAITSAASGAARGAVSSDKAAAAERAANKNSGAIKKLFATPDPSEIKKSAEKAAKSSS